MKLLKEILKIERSADVNVKDKYGNTVLICALIEGQTEIAKLLIEKGASINSKDNIDRTALIWALLEGHTEIASLLIERVADVNLKDSYANTALIWALIKGQIEIAKLLIDKGANVNVKDKYGNTPLIHIGKVIKDIDVKDKQKRDEYVNVAYMLINSMITYYSSLINNPSYDSLSIQEYIHLLQRTISLPTDLFIEIISYL